MVGAAVPSAVRRCAGGGAFGRQLLQNVAGSAARSVPCLHGRSVGSGRLHRNLNGVLRNRKCLIAKDAVESFKCDMQLEYACIS